MNHQGHEEHQGEFDGRRTRRARRCVRGALLTICLFFVAAAWAAPLTVTPLISDHGVIQRDMPVTVWGNADAGAQVTVEFRGQKKLTTSGTDGRWKVALDPMSASAEESVMKISAGGQTLERAGLLVGEVWLCSGQSNMVWELAKVENAAKEVAEAKVPLLRVFKVECRASDEPLETLTGSWQVCQPEVAGEISAVPYFFGRELVRDLGVPVGVVVSAWGGTQIQSWISPEAYQKLPGYEAAMARYKAKVAGFPAEKKQYDEQLAAHEVAVAAAQAKGEEYTRRAPRKVEGPNSRATPSGIYNAMIQPLLPLTLRGILWYQGESNVSTFADYQAQFLAMIPDWQRKIGPGNLPFYFVQLPGFGADDPRELWPRLREAQMAALTLPNTAMAVTIDVGDARNLHPPKKKEVGQRLAQIALAKTYGKDVSASGPIFQKAEREAGKMKIQFADGQKLVLKDQTPNGFVIAGEDRIFHPATVEIVGDSLLVSAQEVPQPVAVRYAWSNVPPVTLWGANGLPASPFRTDNWPVPQQIGADAAK